MIHLRELVPTAAAIEHIGSTSVQGMSAKDCLDMMIVPHLDPAVAESLSAAGYRRRPEPWNNEEPAHGERWPKMVFAPPVGGRRDQHPRAPCGSAHHPPIAVVPRLPACESGADGNLGKVQGRRRTRCERPGRVRRNQRTGVASPDGTGRAMGDPNEMGTASLNTLTYERTLRRALRHQTLLKQRRAEPCTVEIAPTGSRIQSWIRRQGCACSICNASRSSSDSVPWFDDSIAPIGSPSSVAPAGTEIAGPPVALCNGVNPV